MLFEACVETLEEALIAEKNGARRIELCSRLDLDGLTPSPDLVGQVCREVKIPVMVMIRPRAGDFIYTEEEVRRMGNDIGKVKALGASGIVLGLLTPDTRIDITNCKLLTAKAFPLPVTFHKAIDLMEDPAEGVRQLRKVRGVTRILTSGGKPTAKEGSVKIREMIREAGDEIIIMAAGKVTNENAEEIRQLTGASEFHGRKIVGEPSQGSESGLD